MKNAIATDGDRPQHLRLFRRSGLVVTVDPTLIFLLPLLGLTLRWRLLPYFYSGLETVQYWGMALIITLGFFGSLIVHEMVHMATARKFHQHPRGFHLQLFGAGIPLELSHVSWVEKLRFYLGASAVNLLLAICFGALVFLGDTQTYPLYVTGTFLHLACANLSIALFQALPAPPLDTGAFLLSLFPKEGKGRKWGLAINFVVGYLVVAGFFVVGIYEVIRERPVLGAWLLILGAVLWRASLLEREYLSDAPHPKSKNVP